MRRSVFKATALVLFVLVAQVGLKAQECRTADLRGGFALLAAGAVTIPDTPITGPFRRVSRGVFDGEGNVKASPSIASYNGLIFNEPFEGTYSIRPDCTLTMTVNVPAPLNFPVTFTGVLSTDFREFGITPVFPPGSALIGRLRKQRIRGCTAADLVGAYRLELSGRVVQPPAQAGEFVRFGKFVADGAGGFTATTTASYNGLFANENLSGRYTVDSECMLTIRYDVTTPTGTTSITVLGPLVDGGDGAFLMQTDPPGAAIAGSLFHAPRR